MLDVAKGMVTRNTVELCSALDMAAAVHDLSICRDVFKVFFFQPKIVTKKFYYIGYWRSTRGNIPG